MKNPKYFVVAVVALLCATLPAVIAGQTRERFGISAKAGGVNTVVGSVMVRRKDQQPQLLSSTDNLAAKEAVTTGASSNVEVLLNPGSYLRLGENSVFQFEDISLDNLSVLLARGSAIIEATGVADMNLGIKVATAQGDFTIMRSGVYRLDVQPDSATLAVIKGRASFGPNKTDVVKGGKVVTLANGTASIAKLERNKDAFEAWSKQRAELLAKANSKLLNRNFNAFLSSSLNSWDPWLWAPRRAGLWTYSSRLGCYTFLPFYYGWSSPYGHYYGSYFWRGPSYFNQYGTFGNQGGTIVSNPNPGAGTGTFGGNSGGGVTPTPGSGPGPAPVTVSPNQTGLGNPSPIQSGGGGRPINRDQ